jgi:hypothetical protein
MLLQDLFPLRWENGTSFSKSNGKDKEFRNQKIQGWGYGV